MKRLLLVAALTALALPASATSAQSSICKKKSIVEILEAEGQDASAGIADVDCADVTGDGYDDAVFTVNSGGSAGPTQVGVIRGTRDVLLVFLQDGYKVSVDAVNDTRFDIQQPIYKEGDANCCPSAYTFTPYRWKNDDFKAGKAKRYKEAKQRFFD